MRWKAWTFAVAASSAATVFAAPRPNGSRAEMNAHRAAAHALLSAHDIDGALLELEAAYRQSCDDVLARELTVLKAQRTSAARLDDDELAPVHVPRAYEDDDDLAPVRIRRASVDDDELAPVHVPRANEDDDELAPVHVPRAEDDDDLGR
jgi:hypothetical protein